MRGVFDLPGIDNSIVMPLPHMHHCVQSTMKFQELALVITIEGVKLYRVELMYLGTPNGSPKWHSQGERAMTIYPWVYTIISILNPKNIPIPSTDIYIRC